MSRLYRSLCCAMLLSTGLLAQTQPAVNPPIVKSDATKSATQRPLVLSASKSAQKPQAQTQYSHGDPTDQEQLLLELINRARMNPAAEGDSLFNTTDTWVVNNYNYWHVDKAGVRSAFKTYPKRPPLAFHPKAIIAARAHSADMRDHQFQDHTGSDGSNPGTRMSKAGYTVSAWGENIFAYAHSMWEAECGFLVDWGTGNEGLGHRHNTMNFGATDEIWTEIGIGVYAGSGSVGPWVVTEDFGIRGEHYITGVVYKDKNNNKQYDAGEGVSGVTITPSQGSYYAVSSSSGGYAIPMGTATGTVFVTAEGNGINDSKAVSLNGKENVKADFGSASTPIVILQTPEDQSIIGTDTTSLTWKALTGATLYHVQVARDEEFKTKVYNDSTIASTKTSFLASKLLLDTTYYWRARAKSSLGWGEWVPPFSFTVAIAPSTVKLLAPAMGEKLKDKNFSFKWTKSAPGVTKYWLEVSRDSVFTDQILYNYDVPDTAWVLDDQDGVINKDTTYYWHVAGFHNDNVQGAFSPFNWFIISDAVNPVGEDKPIVVQTLSPNPVRGMMMLNYSVTERSSVSFTLCDERGAVLAHLGTEEVEAGDHVKSLDFGSGELSNLSSGSYFLRFNNGHSISTRKIVLMR